jgi:malate dehydrogenase
MATVCILGAGDLGGAVAHALARGGLVSRVLLIDSAANVAAGKALDIQQSGAIEGFHTQLSATDDMTRATACGVCVIADKAGRTPVEWHGEEGLALLGRVAGYAATAPLVLAGTLQTPLLAAIAREAGVRRERLIGSAAEAFAAAVTAIVAMEARCSPTEVNLAVLGAPSVAAGTAGAGPRPGFVIPWSEASIGGYALDRVLTQVQLARLEARAARLWPPGPYALGLAAARVVEALLTSSRRAVNVLSVLGGEFGARGRVGCLPALLSPQGIAHVRVPMLNTRERIQVETALGV